MNARWFILVYILKIHLKSTTTQNHYAHRHHYYDDNLRQYDDDDDPDEYDEPSSEYNIRRRAKHRKEEECYCTCDACFTREGPKPCCYDFCRYCHTAPALPNPDPYTNPERKVVFVPFPYPLIVPNHAQNDAATEIQTSTTVKPHTDATRSGAVTTKKPVTKPDNEESTKLANSTRSQLRTKIVEVDMLSKHRQLQQLNPAVKRTRPAWVPKYGIVPIPDNLAAKLMTQLTEVRALKAKRL